MILSSPASKSNSVPAMVRVMEQGIWFVTLMLHMLMGVLVAVSVGGGDVGVSVGTGVGVAVGAGLGVSVGGGVTVGVAVGV